AAGRNAVDRLHPRYVVLLERDAAPLQIRDFAFDVGDLPERLAGAIGAGVLRRIQEAAGAVRTLIDPPAGDFLRRTTAERLLVERTGASDIVGRQIRVHR